MTEGQFFFNNIPPIPNNGEGQIPPGSYFRFVAGEGGSFKDNKKDKNQGGTYIAFQHAVTGTWRLLMVAGRKGMSDFVKSMCCGSGLTGV